MECNESFVPKRPHQRFHTTLCRVAQWNLDHPRIGVGTATVVAATAPTPLDVRSS